MKYFIFLTFLAFVNAGIINTKSTCVTIRSLAYEQEVLRQGVTNPYQFAIDYNTNTLFFSYTAYLKDVSKTVFKIAFLNLKTNDYGLVSGIKGGFATAIDKESHTVYMGGEDGIYRFNYDTKSATKLNNTLDVKIWQMFYKDVLYFTTSLNEKAFMYKDQEIVQLPQLKYLVMILGVKNDGNYVYSNSSGLFTYNKATGQIMNNGDYIVNGITADINGNLYFSTPTGIYFINDENNEIEELMTEQDVYGVAVEGNGNIIIGKEESVVRLKPTTEKCSDTKIENNIT